METLVNTIEVSAESGTGFDISIGVDVNAKYGEGYNVNITTFTSEGVSERCVIIEDVLENAVGMTIEQARAFAAALTENANRLERALAEDSGARLFEVSDFSGGRREIDETTRFLIEETVVNGVSGLMAIRYDEAIANSIKVGDSWGGREYYGNRFKAIAVARMVQPGLFAEVAA